MKEKTIQMGPAYISAKVPDAQRFQTVCEKIKGYGFDLTINYDTPECHVYINGDPYNIGQVLDFLARLQVEKKQR